MKKLEIVFGAGWAMAGLLALRMVMGNAPASQGSVVEEIRTRCELPAGTVVFVVRDPAQEAP